MAIFWAFTYFAADMRLGAMILKDNLKDFTASHVFLMAALFLSEETMNNRLHQIQNWPERAQQADWCADSLAKQQGVSLRTLQRHFLKEFGQSPKAWLAERRQIDGMEILKKCSCIKTTASSLGYKHTHHFSRDFKAHWGYCPAEMIAQQRLNL